MRAMLIVAVVGTSCGDPTPPDVRGSVQGTVRDADDHAPLAGAAVTVGDRSTVTGTDGTFRLDEFPAGSATVSVTLDGYQSYEAQVEVPAADVVTLDIDLAGTSVPRRPTGFRAIATHDPPGVIDLSWSASARTSSYNLYWSTAPGVTPATGERIPVAALGYSHTGRSASTTYYYVLTAVNEAGESPPSAEAGATAGTGITIVQGLPEAGQVVNDLFSLELRFGSTFQIVSVTATVAGRTTSLALQSDGFWRGTVDLTGLPRGSHPLAITAVDGPGNSALTTVELVLDRPPTLVVALPLDGTVARTSVEVSVTCIDDDPAGCLQTRAIVNDDLLLVGSGGVSGVVPLVRGIDEVLTLQGVDRLNQTVLQQRTVIVEPSARLVPVSVGSSGFVVDADATRLLIFEFNGGNVQLRVRERASSAETIVTGDATSGSALVDGGAVFTRYPSPFQGPALFLWRTGMTPIEISRGVFFTTAGPFVAYEATPGVERRNATTDGPVVVSGDNAYDALAVANGDVVYGTPGGLFRFTDAGVITLDTGGAGFVPLAADETSAVAAKLEPGNRFALVLYDAAGDTQLTGLEPYDFGFQHPPAAVAGGWTAFSRLTSGIRQVWTRSPAGQERQVSFFSDEARLEDLSPTGDVLFVVPPRGGGAEGRYLVRAAGTAELISREHGQGLFLDGVPNVMLGNTLFQVQ